LDQGRGSSRIRRRSHPAHCPRAGRLPPTFFLLKRVLDLALEPHWERDAGDFSFINEEDEVVVIGRELQFEVGDFIF
jgi:hypothetical protein